MAELPGPSDRTAGPPVRFPPRELKVDGRSLRLQRLDAQAAVDRARQHNISTRHALLAASPGLDAAPARAAADDASSALRAAVDVLTALHELDGAGVPALLEVDVDVDGEIVVVRPHGELDLYTSPRLEQICVEQLDARSVDLLVVDLSAVTFLDSSALAVLVEVHRVCGENRTRFTLTGPTPRTRRLLGITRLDTVLDVL